MKMVTFDVICRYILCAALAVFSVSTVAEDYEYTIEDIQLELEDAKSAIDQILSEDDKDMKVSGYVDVEYKTSKDKREEFRMHHFSLFFSKYFTSRFKFFSEIEFEDTPKFEGSGGTVGDAEGKIFLEAVNFDYLYKQGLNFRVGRFFTPAGIWSENHYPPYVTTQERPMHIRAIFPQLVDGGAIDGTFRLGKDGSYFQYNVFVGNGEADSSGKKDENSSKASGMRLGVSLPVADELKFGVSAYRDNNDTSNGNAEKSAIGAHAKVRIGRLYFQTEWAESELSFDDSALDYTRSGLYFQTGIKMGKYFLGHRYDIYESSSLTESEKTRQTLFVNYRALSNVVIKGEYHQDSFVSETTDDTSFLIFSIAAYFGR